MLALSVATACDPRPRVAQPCVSLARERSCSPFCAPPAHAGEPDAAAVESCGGGDDWTHGAVWRGGELLAELLHAQPCLVRERGVLEIGAGTGVAGLAAAAAGAAHVTLTDRDLSASSASLSLNPALQGAVDVRRLAWGDAPSLAAALSAAGGRFEVVLAADVVYPQSTAALPALLETVRNATAPLGRALLLYVERDARVSEALGAGLRGFGGACGRVELGAKAALFELGGAGGGAGGGRPRGCDAVPGGGRVGAC